MYKKILVPLDGSPRGEAILPQVEDLAQTFEAEIILTQVVEPMPFRAGSTDTLESEMHALKIRENDALQYLAAKAGELRHKGFRAQSYVMYGGVVDAIVKLADTEGADLIAIASHGRSGLGHLFHGSIAMELINRAKQPLLVIRSRGG